MEASAQFPVPLPPPELGTEPPPAIPDRTEAPLFTVTGQDIQPNYQTDQPQTFDATIRFRTRSGVDSFVVVPQTEYDPQYVAALISDEARKIESITTLGS